MPVLESLQWDFSVGCDHWLDVCPWASYVFFLGFNFLVYKWRQTSWGEMVSFS